MSFKIYFAGSIRGGRQDAALYERIIKQLQQYGHVFTEHVGNPDLEKGEVDITDKQIHDRDMNWMQESDVLVAECTQPSLGVGYEIGQAFALNKKILCLFRPDSGKSLSAMIRGAENGTSFVVKDYKEGDIPDLLKNFFSNL
ncbi:hypothetical protein C0Q70_21612 [Pomacea canaliculata]|uniref:Putative 2'-deoxynucleoside 5'-phosphate N-hydrolase 1 n=1 Tax=Pomacea canaliculata TaxID=400727 RepID=A0A2T7ND06_POMCA|nr:putative 2'-deoxynucleoside 5'-phosphate N-hydrolase 1 [Pomacea canaliculata]XP_025080114.1 putative 2'-deoxynucleoside 5'-phosphate N-hydrolase 1 [Pomacea canaliculata]XP_025080115.1 putative 2'-deoxynucleoside 5'-phosphate N-hydrolase 1 [Pomacea canaliculata]XP_025080116.1 putative 2'-deoxynucleoside 5'-phosphate N-hydrolase 1 [Pomacea canaliculata]XP_025080117.1 putative 2'-deoxynucleoside 5'-phosphate N-hydrolase 1 [Pomacea canaliculata]XP_025080118.1 putative 2'-deoxynucleoside 5'-phos